jgi:cytochrome P450
MTVPRLDIDFSDPALVADPIPALDEIREAGRVSYNGLAGAYMVPGYDDCAEMLADTKGSRFAVPGALRPDVYFWFEAPALSVTEGAVHRRLRQGLARYFTATAMRETWEPRIRGVTEELLRAALAGRDQLDLEDFTKIPVVVVGKLLGIPEERYDDFRRWTHVIIDNIAFGNEPPEVRRAMDDAVAESKAYLSEEVERHRRERPDDLLTVMLDLPGWSDAEVRSVALNLFLAGYDTTAKLLGEALVTLEAHPDQRRLLAREPALMPNAVEEILRFSGPTQAIVRVVMEEAELAGTRFAVGDTVYLVFGAANRDPARWEDPHRFDVRREAKPNLTFGSGVHVCIGGPLARMETRIALETLLRLAPDYHLRDIDYGTAFFARGPARGVIDVGVPATA